MGVSRTFCSALSFPELFQKFETEFEGAFATKGSISSGSGATISILAFAYILGARVWLSRRAGSLERSFETVV